MFQFTMNILKHYFVKNSFDVCIIMVFRWLVANTRIAATVLNNGPSQCIENIAMELAAISVNWLHANTKMASTSSEINHDLSSNRLFCGNQ